MPTGVLRRHARDRLESLSRLVKPSAIEGPFPLSADDYQELLDLVLEFPNVYRKAVDTELRKIFTERSRSLDEWQQARSDLEETADHYTALVRALEEDSPLRTLAGQHPFLQSLRAKLSEAAAILQSARTHLDEDWPVCSPQELADALDENKQGRFRPVEEVFAEMKGISVEELHRRLEEHKAKRKDYGWE